MQKKIKNKKKMTSTLKIQVIINFTQHTTNCVYINLTTYECSISAI